MTKFQLDPETLMPASTPVLVGPSGWNFPHWEGVIYPSGKPKGFHPLQFIAERFDIAEIPSSFDSYPRPEVVKLWLDKSACNPRFQFVARLHRQFTHERRMDIPSVEAFCAALRPLRRAKKLGAVLMTFPWSFRFTQENRDYFIQLRRAFAEFPLVAEMRHESWGCPEAIGTFIDYRVGFANIDQPDHIRAMGPTAHLTSGIGYVRLHGKQRPDWYVDFEERQPSRGAGYKYSVAELDEWQTRIRDVAAFADKSFVFFTNDAGGHSFWNALEMNRRFATPKRQPSRTEGPLLRHLAVA
jgi:uncharacterized protein YecE (DUF72 family)